jgi:hypothetical protein
MRCSLPGALLFSIVVGGVTAVAGCAAQAAPSASDQAALGDDELNAVNNKMGLRLTYDDPSGRVHATIKMTLQTGERLVLRVRRGRLTVGGQVDLDCSQLAEALPLPAPATTTMMTGTTTGTTSNTTAAPMPSTKPIYVGPEVDRSLLASVYNQQWIDMNISGAVLEQLSVDGADSIVDACIVRDEGVRARLQTSIQYAWDTRDPHIDPALVHGH